MLRHRIAAPQIFSNHRDARAASSNPQRLNPLGQPRGTAGASPARGFLP